MVYVYVVGKVLLPPNVTVTELVRATLPREAVMVDDPAPTAVSGKDALLLPLETVTLKGTVATAVLDEDNETDVFEVTAVLMPTVIVCTFPGVIVTVEGEKVLRVGVLPPPLAPVVAINK